MATPREKFQSLLRELFQFDAAELDFGIYRIMNHKRAVIERFIEKDLLDAVSDAFKQGAAADQDEARRREAELRQEVIENLGAEALDAEGNLIASKTSPLGKRYLEAQELAKGAKSAPELESAVFNHLHAFFSRYYSDGDFMSLRRYSRREKYAIPYNGEEVYLHWANSDQYYIKSGENFTDYLYRHGGWTIAFKLRNADVEQNNVKGAKRLFVPRLEDISSDTTTQTFTVPFEFRPLTADEEARFGRTKVQDAIIAEAVPTIEKAAAKMPEVLTALAVEKRRDADGQPISMLAHHLRVYTRKNTSDFFIHKDLQGFLERELDFYLKNEVLNVDELEVAGESRAEGWFQLLRTIKPIGGRIILFLAQIENLQKRLFEKKKFVTYAGYCITLDHVPERLYSEIAKNNAQIKEWCRLFHIHEIERDTIQPEFSDPLTVEFLRANPFLVLDTKFFSKAFEDELLASIKNIDETFEGVLIWSENFQALQLVRAKYSHNINCIYIDPPYNTDASAIIYKNNYKDSSWLALLENRLALAKPLLRADGMICVAIDDEEASKLHLLLTKYFEKQVGVAVVRSNPAGRKTKGRLAPAHEYAMFFGNSEASAPGCLEVTAKRLARYPLKDSKGNFAWANFVRSGSGDKREDRPTMYYPIFVSSKDKLRVPKLKWDEGEEAYEVLEQPKRSEEVVYPIVDGIEKRWQRGHERIHGELDDYRIRRSSEGEITIDFKTRMDDEALPTTWWDKKEYASANYGAAELKDLFGKKIFDFAKARRLVEDCLLASGGGDAGTFLDFLAGSGTTGHATINLNRDNGAKRKYILTEVGDYFETVLTPRIKKAVYSKEWKKGKPVSRQGSSHAFKYIRLESYEDALDNIAFDEPSDQTTLQLDDYVISYMLEFEGSNSGTLLDIEGLESPFDYKLKLHGKDEPSPVDLAETFNYVIGLHVRSRRVLDSNGVRYLVYGGQVEGRETVIIWRTTRGWKEKEFELDRQFILDQKLIDGAEDIFVNTDSFVEGARSLDPVFKRRMFNEE
jgi:adenine-specific DNA-methyltransferase